MLLGDSPTPKRHLGRDLAIWFCCFFFVASLLIIYMRMPIVPLLCGGVFTLVLTIIRKKPFLLSAKANRM